MKPTKVKIKVTIEREGEDDNVLEMEYDDVVVCQERGYVKTYIVCGVPVDITLNGHERVLIKAWKGCADYDAFVGSEARTVLPSVAEIELKSDTVRMSIMKSVFERLTTARSEVLYPDGFRADDIGELLHGDGLLTMGGVTAPREVWRDTWRNFLGKKVGKTK